MTPPSPARPSKRNPKNPVRPESSARPAANPYALNQNPEVVDPVWLLKALGIIVAGAMLCGYMTLCTLFYKAQWQLVLHPSHGTPLLATTAGESFETIHFAVDETGNPQLVGKWLPAAAGGRYASTTALYLPSGDGSLADASDTLADLHNLGINVFAFDYRGYGQSAPMRPNQQRMEEDARSAWRYLTSTRSIPASSILPFGVGVGAALAVDLASQHSELPAVIVRNAKPNLLGDVLADPRTRLLPVHLLFHNRFEIAPSLAVLSTPKLLIADDAKAPVAILYRSAADPKFTVFLPPGPSSAPLSTALARFLDQYLVH